MPGTSELIVELPPELLPESSVELSSELFPHVAPQSLTLPWLVAFTTRARRDGDALCTPQSLDFTAGRGDENRRELERWLAPLAVTWLTLEHGTKIATINSTISPTADAAIITQPGFAVAFTTADCLPLVCVDVEKEVVVAIHAGWRSLAGGIIERTVERLRSECATSPEQLKIWIGPAIARDDYEVGREVHDALLTRPGVTEEQFVSRGQGHFLADLPGAATTILTSLGVPAQAIERYPVSTKQSPLLHSVRRDGAQAGRMATVVGIRELPSPSPSSSPSTESSLSLSPTPS
jgi:YfiH family protein